MHYFGRVVSRAALSARDFVQPGKKVHSLWISALAALIGGWFLYVFFADTLGKDLWVKGVTAIGAMLVALVIWWLAVFLVYLALTPAKLDAERREEIDRLERKLATFEQRPPLADFQTRSDKLRKLAREYRKSHDDRVMWLEWLVPDKRDWADYADVLDKWEKQLRVVIKRSDDSSGYHNIKFELPKDF